MGQKALADVSGALTTDRTEENIDWQYVSGKDAVAAVDDKDVQILDVRDDDTYKAGHLKRIFPVRIKKRLKVQMLRQLCTNWQQRRWILLRKYIFFATAETSVLRQESLS